VARGDIVHGGRDALLQWRESREETWLDGDFWLDDSHRDDGTVVVVTAVTATQNAAPTEQRIATVSRPGIATADGPFSGPGDGERSATIGIAGSAGRDPHSQSVMTTSPGPPIGPAGRRSVPSL